MHCLGNDRVCHVLHLPQRPISVCRISLGVSHLTQVCRISPRCVAFILHSGVLYVTCVRRFLYILL